jgi:5-(carboxyamino)imidazole ribonucleotide mutase
VDEPVVGILVGSPVDQNVMEEAAVILEKFGVAHELEVMSAHREPLRVATYASQAESRGLEVLIAGDSRAAHLPGVVAAHTVLPVIGVPIASTSALGGTDALYCIVQMPKGVPVATVAVDGAANAAVLAVQILSVADTALRDELREFKQQLSEGPRR